MILWLCMVLSAGTVFAGPLSRNSRPIESSFAFGNDLNLEFKQVGFSDDVQVLNVNGTDMCQVDEVLYPAGADLPTADPCEFCVCNPPGFACEVVACDIKPGCRSLERAGLCCPEFVCDCEQDGAIYDNTEFVPSSDPCLQCFCVTGEVTCSVIGCANPPLPQDNCVVVHEQGKCCASYTNCTKQEEIDEDLVVEAPDVLQQIAAETLPEVEIIIEEKLSEVEETLETTLSSDLELATVSTLEIESDSVGESIPSPTEDVVVGTSTDIEVQTVDAQVSVVQGIPSPALGIPSPDEQTLFIVDSEIVQPEIIPTVVDLAETTVEFAPVSTSITDTEAAVVDIEPIVEAQPDPAFAAVEDGPAEQPIVVEESEIAIEQDQETETESSTVTEIAAENDEVGNAEGTPVDEEDLEVNAGVSAVKEPAFNIPSLEQMEHVEFDADEDTTQLTTLSPATVPVTENDISEGDLTTEEHINADNDMNNAIKFPEVDKISPGDVLPTFLKDYVGNMEEVTLIPDVVTVTDGIFHQMMADDGDNKTPPEEAASDSEDDEGSFWISMLGDDSNDAEENGVTESAKAVSSLSTRLNDKVITIEDDDVSGSQSDEPCIKTNSVHESFILNKGSKIDLDTIKGTDNSPKNDTQLEVQTVSPDMVDSVYYQKNDAEIQTEFPNLIDEVTTESDDIWRYDLTTLTPQYNQVDIENVDLENINADLKLKVVETSAQSFESTENKNENPLNTVQKTSPTEEDLQDLALNAISRNSIITDDNEKLSHNDELESVTDVLKERATEQSIREDVTEIYRSDENELENDETITESYAESRTDALNRIAEWDQVTNTEANVERIMMMTIDHDKTNVNSKHERSEFNTIIPVKLTVEPDVTEVETEAPISRTDSPVEEKTSGIHTLRDEDTDEMYWINMLGNISPVDKTGPKLLQTENIVTESPTQVQDLPSTDTPTPQEDEVVNDPVPVTEMSSINTFEVGGMLRSEDIATEPSIPHVETILPVAHDLIPGNISQDDMEESSTDSETLAVPFPKPEPYPEFNDEQLEFLESLSKIGETRVIPKDETEEEVEPATEKAPVVEIEAAAEKTEKKRQRLVKLAINRKLSRPQLRKRPLTIPRRRYRVVSSNESKDLSKLRSEDDEVLSKHMDAHFLQIARKYGLRPLTVKKNSFDLKEKRKKFRPISFRRRPIQNK